MSKELTPKERKAEYDREYRKRNKERIAEYKRAWARKNSLRISDQKHEYYMKHKKDQKKIKHKGISTAVTAMMDMVKFLADAEKDWADASEDFRRSGNQSASAIMEAKSDAMWYARRKAEYLLSWISQEESED